MWREPLTDQIRTTPSCVLWAAEIAGCRRGIEEREVFWARLAARTAALRHEGADRLQAAEMMIREGTVLLPASLAALGVSQAAVCVAALQAWIVQRVVNEPHSGAREALDGASLTLVLNSQLFGRLGAPCTWLALRDPALGAEAGESPLTPAPSGAFAMPITVAGRRWLAIVLDFERALLPRLLPLDGQEFDVLSASMAARTRERASGVDRAALAAMVGANDDALRRAISHLLAACTLADEHQFEAQGAFGASSDARWVHVMTSARLAERLRLTRARHGGVGGCVTVATWRRAASGDGAEIACRIRGMDWRPGAPARQTLPGASRLD